MDRINARQLSDGAFTHLDDEKAAHIKTVEIDNARYILFMSALGQELVAAESYDAVVAEACERDLAVVTLN